MIIYGTRGSIVKGGAVEGYDCMNCGADNLISFGLQRYFHIYWIPTFQTSRKVGLECLCCGSTYLDDELPEELQINLKPGLFSLSGTLAKFTGLFIIGILALFAVINVTLTEADRTSYFASPAVGDLYVVDATKVFNDVNSDYKYIVMKIDSVTPEKTVFKLSQVGYTKPRGSIKDIDNGKAWSESYYHENSVTLEASKLSQLFDSNVISTIERR